MSKKILQVNFKMKISGKQYKQTYEPAAGVLAAVPGLLWKVWIVNDQEHEAGGIYFFDSETSIKDFMESEIVASVIANPDLSDFSVKTFDIIEDLSTVTRGPIAP
jgi:hypothetical protein